MQATISGPHYEIENKDFSTHASLLFTLPFSAFVTGPHFFSSSTRLLKRIPLSYPNLLYVIPDPTWHARRHLEAMHCTCPQKYRPWRAEASLKLVRNTVTPLASMAYSSVLPVPDVVVH